MPNEGVLRGLSLAMTIQNATGHVSGGGTNKFGYYYVSNGEETIINNQGPDEYNTIICDAGVRFTLFQCVLNSSRLWVFCASPTPFTFKCYSYKTGQPPSQEISISGQINILGDQYYYVYAYWYNPIPSATLYCNVPPFLSPNQVMLTDEEVLQVGSLLTYGAASKKDL